MSIRDFGKIFSPLFLNALILRLLKMKPSHGYEIAEKISKITGLSVAKPLIYITLKKLETLGLVISKWEVSDGKAKKIYYITEAGEDFLEMNRQILSKLKEILDFLLEGGK